MFLLIQTQASHRDWPVLFLPAQVIMISDQLFDSVRKKAYISDTI